MLEEWNKEGHSRWEEKERSGCVKNQESQEEEYRKQTSGKKLDEVNLRAEREKGFKKRVLNGRRG